MIIFGYISVSNTTLTLVPYHHIFTSFHNSHYHPLSDITVSFSRRLLLAVFFFIFYFLIFPNTTTTNNHSANIIIYEHSDREEDDEEDEDGKTKKNIYKKIKLGKIEMKNLMDWKGGKECNVE